MKPFDCCKLAKLNFILLLRTDKSVDQVTLAFAQRLAGDTAGAKVTAAQAHNTLEQLFRDQPGSAFILANLSQAYAVMGDKNSALKVAERAIMLMPSAKDAVADLT